MLKRLLKMIYNPFFKIKTFLLKHNINQKTYMSKFLVLSMFL